MDDRPRMDLICPDCGKKTQKLIRWFEQHDVFTCRCGSEFDCAKIIDGLKAAPPNPNPGYPQVVRIEL